MPRASGEAGLKTIAEALPLEVHQRTAGLLPLSEWIPVEDLIAWHMAVWSGPADRDQAVMTRHAQLTVDHGFGRVKRLMVSALTPQLLADRVGPLWHEEYSTGRLETLLVESQSAQLSLSNHDFVDIPLMRLIIAEDYRYILSMTRAKNVTAAHAVLEGALIVTLRWE